MIISSQNDQMQLITQVDHALASGELARQWGNGDFVIPSPVDSVCLGTARHDEGWRDRDQHPFFDAENGRPLNFFEIDMREHMQFYREGVNRVTAEDLYAGLLAGMHWIGLYRDRWGVQPGLSRLPESIQGAIEDVINEEEMRWQQIKRKLWNRKERRSTFERSLWQHYDLLQVWDRLSLYVCLSDLRQPSMQDIPMVPIGLDGDVVDLHVKSQGNGVVTLDPFPFATEVELSIPARHLPNQRFESASRFNQMFEEATVEPLHCTFRAGTA